GNQDSDERANYAIIRGGAEPAVITLKEPVALEKIRFKFADRDPSWYTTFWPFSWQDNPVHQSNEAGENWYMCKVEVSADQTHWTVVEDRLMTAMMRTCPVFVDWNHDGKLDLVLGILNASGSTPHDKEFRLYLNKGTNADPKFEDYLSF